MTITGANLLAGLNRFIGDEFDPAGLATSAAGDSGGTTLIDDTLGEYDDDALVGMWVRIGSYSDGTTFADATILMTLLCAVALSSTQLTDIKTAVNEFFGLSL